MHKKTIKEKIAQVMAFVRDQAPDWITYRQVMYEFNISATLAREWCKTAGEISEVYEYDRGLIRYTGNPEVFNSGHKTLEEAFKDDEDKEEPVQLGVSETIAIQTILRAIPSSPEDKGTLKMPRRPKKEWKPNGIRD